MRTQSLLLKAWSCNAMATEEEPCPFWGNYLSSRATLVSQPEPHLEYKQLQLCVLEYILLPEHVTKHPVSRRLIRGVSVDNRSSTVVNSLVTPRLRDDILVFDDDYQTPFPLPLPPHERMVKMSSTLLIPTCAPCYTKLKNQLTTMIAMRDEHINWAAHREQAISQLPDDPSEERGGVDRRLHPDPKKRLARQDPQM